MSGARDAGENIVVHLKVPVTSDEKRKIQNFQKKYGMAGVKTVTVSTMPDKSKNRIRNKSLHCFFDMGGTLTRGHATINRKIRSVFDKMKKCHDMRIYFASGRSIPQLTKDMGSFRTEPYGIAENGGIIIGLGDKETFGDRTQPDVLHGYILDKRPKVHEDIDQGYRKTERIYLQKSVSKRRMDGYIKKSKAEVDLHPSKNSYHVSARGVNKGSAIENLATEMRFGPNDFVVAIGDADMDVPMLRASDLGFAIGNASPEVIRAADIPLTGEHEKGIAEMYGELLRLSGLQST